MLAYLGLKNVGPAPSMEMELGSRMNLITGDNGLGKSFLLDVAWWALTRKWPYELNSRLTQGYPAKPTDIKQPAKIAFKLKSKVKTVAYESTYVPREESWQGKAGRPWNPGLVIYAHADGGFSVWDPARNYWKKKGQIDVQDRLPGYVFSAQEVWDGLTLSVDGKPTVVCNGLLRDWSGWIREKGPLADVMEVIVQNLAPRGDILGIGPLCRLSINDARDIPSIQTAYADSVPVLYASSGIRRIIGLSYMLLWSWNEHGRAASQLGEETTSQVVILIDELESHLHPKWQRTILSPLLEIMDALHETASIQLIAATHSPFILASAEPFFDSGQDAWFDLDFEREPAPPHVVLRKRPFVKHGDVSNWLTSNAFDLKSARSLEAEKAMEQAKQLLREPNPNLEQAEQIHQELAKVLPDIDPFWVRWGAFMEKLRGNA